MSDPETEFIFVETVVIKTWIFNSFSNKKHVWVVYNDTRTLQQQRHLSFMDF